ncbi:IS1634 family transposase [Peloplasma aerotolerans]|uniref:IS1634 family transposase n=1 Tax=Peloplasma aerotolerans TaxID=3044389 RepID=A0AAW6U763_9MOLU|nr:IS1634 family transposase [Mariniplasma sp. M4Ah]MDI6453803.1 IS1634 family transposase [Mariniplasma sp. M4Ah]
MKIVKYKLKNEDILYYLAKSVRTGKQVKTVNIEKLGKHSDLILKHKDPLTYLKAYAKKRTAEEKEDFLSIKIDLQQAVLHHKDQKTSHSKLLNIGYFFLNDIYKALKLDTFFKDITKDTKVEYNPHQALKFLTFARILDPKSKLGTFDDLNNYYEKPKIKLQDIYKTLDLVSEHLDQYQTHLYRESINISKRNTSILYYDCTNYFFEIECEDHFRKYGQGKDHKPNPIVQMGLFMDGDGIPLAFSLNPGNTNEQQTTLPLEKKIVKDFKLSNFIYVSDGGLNSNETRFYNSFGNRDYIVTQSLKKLKRSEQDLILTDDHWQSISTGKLKSLSTLKDDDQDTYYKVMWIDHPIDVGLRELTQSGQLKKKTSFKQRLIVTYQKKYALYQSALRLKQIQRAADLIQSNRVDQVSQNSPKRLIEQKGEVSYDLDLDKIKDEIKYDGYYALVTSLEDDDVKDILKASARRWEIEESFRILKSNFKARPVFHRKDTRIISHFAICFTALLVYRLLEKKLDSKYTIYEIIDTLRALNVVSLNEALFKSTYSGSELLDQLCVIFDKKINKNIYTNVQLNKNK